MNNDYLEGMTTVQQRNVTSIYEPQNPLYHKEKDAYFYPLTSEKQIVMDDGRRLNAVLEEDFAKKDEVNSAKAEAIDSSKVYINEQIKKAAPRNLLDNSDFTNPVNQRGQNSWNSGGYSIDRWEIYTWSGENCTLIEDGLHLAADAEIQQFFPDMNLKNKRLTAAMKVNGTILSGVGTMPSTINQVDYAINSGGIQCRLVCLKNGLLGVVMFSEPGHTATVEWAALYEGEYTTETLPEYQPKGYDAELLACQTQLQRFRTESERKTYCEDFRPTMRMTTNGMVSKFEQEIDGVTYYFASAEL